jgi:hypothetical protein
VFAHSSISIRVFIRAPPQSTLSPIRNLDLLFKNWRRSADLLPFQSDIYFDTVGDFDERDATRHAVLFAIESHGAVETAGGRSFAVAREGEFLHLGDTANGEVALDVKVVWSGLNDFRRLESDQRRFLYVKEILTLQLAVLHVVSGVDAVGFNLDVYRGARDLPRRKRNLRVPLLKDALDRNGRIDGKLNSAFLGRNFVGWNLCTTWLRCGKRTDQPCRERKHAANSCAQAAYRRRRRLESWGLLAAHARSVAVFAACAQSALSRADYDFGRS